MKIATWNLNHTLLTEQLISAITSENIDVFVLTEWDGTIDRSSNVLIEQLGYTVYIFPGCDRVSFIVRNTEIIDPCEQNSYFSIIRIISIDTFIIGIHIPSQMYQSINGLKAYMNRLRNHIDDSIGSSTQRKVIIIGDFNVDPFESPLIDFDGFRATNNSKPKKRLKHIESVSEPYVNKTWRLYIRHQRPGTFHFVRPSNSSIDIIDWHYLDQIIISYKLNEEIVSDNIYVLETINTELLINAKNKIQISDHLPLVYQFERR